MHLCAHMCTWPSSKATMNLGINIPFLLVTALVNYKNYATFLMSMREDFYLPKE